VAKFQAPLAGSLIINHREALRLILAAEGWSDFKGVVKDELPAIVSHWLQSPKDAPILLDDSFRDRWLDLLRRHCLLASRNAALGLPEETSHPRPVHIDFSDLPFPPEAKPKFTFIDLFAGIGGFRIALQESGGKCVFSSEWEPHAKETYFNNYGEVPFGDITKFTQSDSGDALISNGIPSHTILCGGFPCQPFSQAGLKRGFDDARGTLFFDILKIARDLRPPVLFLENVKRLKTHDSGNTFKVICNSLRDINYKVYAKVLRASDFGVPQNRERIFIVAFADPIYFDFPKAIDELDKQTLSNILEPNPEAKYTISDALWAGHQRRLKEHREKGNGFGYSLFNKDSKYVNTISARYWKDGSEILIEQEGKNPRILTPRECARIQGFPEQFKFHCSKRYAYQQFGNSVAKPVIRAVMDNILFHMRNPMPAEDLVDIFSPVIE
jgi:DNA (cytosine-5)-methyltransferase 1